MPLNSYLCALIFRNLTPSLQTEPAARYEWFAMKKKGGKKQKILAKNQRRVGSAESIGPEEVKRVGRKKRKN